MASYQSYRLHASQREFKAFLYHRAKVFPAPNLSHTGTTTHVTGLPKTSTCRPPGDWGHNTLLLPLGIKGIFLSGPPIGFSREPADPIPATPASLRTGASPCATALCWPGWSLQYLPCWPFKAIQRSLRTQLTPPCGSLVHHPAVHTPFLN
ncbi:Hypothetical predicted protein [Lynx pardinus]|uniref:Uncharacterized protein n=1 Tax=Lynx pardinus TaxID=191816 RepID=A0A485PMG3_LYNPA|nr:Hypothetical predicted protein [Lynx pardinus]